jgi:site-specific DNA recombinase
MQVAIYARVSTQRQAQAQTTDQQLDRLRAHAEGQGWSLAADHVFRDDGYSGANLRRPGLDRLRDAAASARLDRVLITEPDRLARNYVHQVLLVEELQKHGAEVVFLDRPMSRDPHDQLLLQIRGAVAEYERTLISERMRRGRLRKLRAGTLLPWTRPPYGYRLDPERPRDPAGVRVDEAEAAVVRDLFAWFADEGATILALTQRLARLGLASPRGHRTWNASALRGVLTNPTYLGQVFANRARTRPAERRHSALLPSVVVCQGSSNRSTLPSGSRWHRCPPSSARRSSTARRSDWPIIVRWPGATTACIRISCVAWSAAAGAAWVAAASICRRATTTMSAEPSRGCGCCCPASAVPRATSRPALWRRSAGVCGRAWPRRTSSGSGHCSSCWSTAWSSPTAPSRSATSSRPARRGSTRRFRDCEQTIETAVGRYKALIGPRLRARSLPAQQGEAAIAVEVLNRMIRVAKPVSVRAA